MGTRSDGRPGLRLRQSGDERAGGDPLGSPDDIPARLLDLIARIRSHPEIKGVVVLVVPAGDKSDVEVYGFGPDVEAGEAVDRILDVAKVVIRAH